MAKLLSSGRRVGVSQRAEGILNDRGRDGRERRTHVRREEGARVLGGPKEARRGVPLREAEVLVRRRDVLRDQARVKSARGLGDAREDLAARPGRTLV